MWENMGRYLKNFSPPVVWNFTPKQLQDPDEVIECLEKKKCCGYSKEAQLTAPCWALASIYQTLLDIMQHTQGKERENIPTDTMAKPETIIVAPITKKKQWKPKSACLVRDEEASPKREQEKESEEAACSAAEHSQELEGKEAQQLGSLAKDKTIDKGIGKKAGVLSLWRRLLSSVKDSKWTNIEGGIQYLRELAMLEVICNNLDDNQASKDPDEIQ
ncbi:hypothetical protein QYF61_018886 [Mycteria americana]|uniref:Uncharacterized protein n=1 Tax=Mycteria americana TaxID=33587 RepID=A0AAN7P6N3_MYCAM|nr:hypothetical protein QYF61_018886 [Mycteria americana]